LSSLFSDVILENIVRYCWRKIEMKEKAQRALLAAVIVVVGITFVMLVNGEGFSLFKTGLYAAVAFVAEYFFSWLFEGRKS